MTARPKFGDAIAVGGVRPAWLLEGVDFLVQWELDGWSDDTFQVFDVEHAWKSITAIRLEVPRYDFVYLALERGMVPWFGGDEAPGDWDGGGALLRNGCIVFGIYRWAIGYPTVDGKEATGPVGTDVIGYTRKATSTALPLTHPAAPQGEVLTMLDTDNARLEIWKAIKSITIGNKTDDKLIVAKLAGQGVYLAALAPAAIASGREGAE